MTRIKSETLKPILESSNGLHLSIYLPLEDNLKKVKQDLRALINEAQKSLSEVLKIDQKRRFLLPLQKLLKKDRVLGSINGNVALFRTENSFRILRLPVPVEKQIHLATSFHVKPILRWLQIDQEFLLLGLSENSLKMYSGNQSSLQLLGTLDFGGALKNHLSPQDTNPPWALTKIAWINEVLVRINKSTNPCLFVAGQKSELHSLASEIQYGNLVWPPISNDFSEKGLSEISSRIRDYFNREALTNIRNSLTEFRFAEEIGLGERNIFNIARAAVSGKVSKLIVAEGVNLYGKLDKQSGALTLHPYDLDHEDDDILDDLAQQVLKSGAEVLVADHDDIPKGHPVLAVLKAEPSSLEQVKEIRDFQVLREQIFL